ncbi:60S ribosomal protein [Dirofilaria immitis]
MVYKRMVEIGRVIFVAKGDDDGKLAAIVDVVDGNRALIDGPSTAKINEKWVETLWAQKLAKKEIKAKMTDFDRFKLMRAKQLRNRLVRLQAAKLRKSKKIEKLAKGK